MEEESSPKCQKTLGARFNPIGKPERQRGGEREPSHGFGTKS